MTVKAELYPYWAPVRPIAKTEETDVSCERHKWSMQGRAALEQQSTRGKPLPTVGKVVQPCELSARQRR